MGSRKSLPTIDKIIMRSGRLIWEIIAWSKLIEHFWQAGIQRPLWTFDQFQNRPPVLRRQRGLVLFKNFCTTQVFRLKRCFEGPLCIFRCLWDCQSFFKMCITTEGSKFKFETWKSLNKKQSTFLLKPILLHYLSVSGPAFFKMSMLLSVRKQFQC